MAHSVLFQGLFVGVLSWTMGDEATIYLIGQCRDGLYKEEYNVIDVIE